MILNSSSNGAMGSHSGSARYNGSGCACEATWWGWKCWVCSCANDHFL